MPRNAEVCPAVFCPHANRSSETWSPKFFFTLRYAPRVDLFWANPVLICSLLILFATSSAFPVHAQSSTATLTGTVLDQAGATVPGVNISVISVVQGFHRNTTSDDDGTFIVPSLPPGSYIVKAERQGFNPTELRNVILNVNDQKAIKVHLKVGDITQTVEVVDGANLIDQTPAVSTVIDRQFVEKLPLNGRSVQPLILLTPGTVLTTTSVTEVGQFSVNGQRADANYATIDGVSANVSPTYSTGAAFSQNNSGSVLGFSALGTTSNLVSVDALQEFTVLTSSYAPEFGRTPGGQISMVTRPGGNDFHGSLFEYFRNDVLDANDWFSNSRGLKRAALRQSIFGGTFSGPILLPRFGEGGKQPWYHGRDQTFFFFSYEGQRLRLPKFLSTEVPSLEARATATQPAIRELLNGFPLPTGPARANRFAEFAAAYSDPASLDATSIRVDHAVNSKLVLFARYSHSPSESITRGNGQSLNTVNTIFNKTQTLTFGATSPLSPTVANEFRANWTRVAGTQTFELDNFGGATPPPFSFFVSPQFATPRSGGQIQLAANNFAILRVGDLAENSLTQINITENLSVSRNSHQMKFGVDYRRLLPVVGSSDYFPQIAFSGVNGALTGRTSLASIVVTTPLKPVYSNFSAYAQDTWKINKRMVLTYGLRWDLNPPPSERNGNDPAVLTDVENLSNSELVFGPPLYETTYTNFAPRVGVSYQVRQTPGREAVVRTGFGIFYDLGNQTAGAAFANGFPYTRTGRINPLPFFPLTPAQLVPPVPSRTIPTTSTILGFAPDLKLPRSYQWNFAVEQSLGSQQTISATYLGAVGRKLLRQQTNNGSVVNNPNFGVVVVTTNGATSDYHALQIQFQRRLSRGLQLMAFHSWSHSIDIASRDSATIESFPVAGIAPQSDRGPSDFDVRHTFRMAATYELPLNTRNKIGKAFLRNWAIDAIYSAQSAPRVDVTYLISPVFNGAFSLLARPDLIPGVPLYITDANEPGGRRINPAAFSIPSTERQGSLGRNSLLGTPVSQLDFVIRRKFQLSERFRLVFRSEFFNLFNHPNFAKPSSSLGINDFGTFFPNNNFGRSLTMLGRGLGGSQVSGLNALYQIGGPRSIQFALRLEY